MVKLQMEKTVVQDNMWAHHKKCILSEQKPPMGTKQARSAKPNINLRLSQRDQHCCATTANKT